MGNWITLRKGGNLLHLSYGHTFTNNLYGHNLQLRTHPEFEIKLDLSPNLRVRNKQSNCYYDARELSEGSITGLKCLQVDDRKSFKIIANALSRLPKIPETWKLTLYLDCDWSFSVVPELKGPEGAESLFLNVVDQPDIGLAPNE
ncbi:hypothetical protein LCGC14_1729530 [marine sediment metagenome]|uniref:Uncharacterized protein n=1 Tax=marine sediment metagenome TaxID=412755 RepID=A0A0F9HXT1_9ZZZZ